MPLDLKSQAPPKRDLLLQLDLEKVLRVHIKGEDSLGSSSMNLFQVVLYRHIAQSG